MISLHSNGLVFGAQHLPFHRIEADSEPQGRTRQPGLTIPHDLGPRTPIILPRPAASQMCHQSHRIAQLLRGRQLDLNSVNSSTAQYTSG